MQYMGGKAKHAKDIVLAIGKHLGMDADKSGILHASNGFDRWVEPFVGGFNMIPRLSGFTLIEASDTNPYLIGMYQAIKGGWKPPTDVSEAEYQRVKALMKSSPTVGLSDEDLGLIGFIGFACSYGGKWFGGYARGSSQNYAMCGHNSLNKKKPGILSTKFSCCRYDEISSYMTPDNTIIYCDPPYAGTTSYKDKFDSEAFWRWCNIMRFAGYKVFVSEYKAPDGWDCIWEKGVNNYVSKKDGKYDTATERLFC